jgi:hypothetical protein
MIVILFLLLVLFLLAGFGWLCEAVFKVFPLVFIILDIVILICFIVCWVTGKWPAPVWWRLW